MSNGKRVTRNAHQLILIVIIVSFLGFPVWAADGRLNSNVSIGYIKAGSAEVASLSWRPDLKIGPLTLGLTINAPLGKDKPEGYESIVLRSAEYNDGKRGLKYGILDNVTLGKGLLMKNYSTRYTGPIIQNNSQTALSGFIKTERVGFEFLSTWSHIYALRLTEQVSPYLILGQSYIADSDGVTVTQTSGTKKVYPAVSGYGFDAAVPLPLNLEGYGEIAGLVDHGQAATIGISWGYEALVFSAYFNAGYRFIDKKFVPGIFNVDYETDPVDFASYEANSQSKDGYLAELKGQMAEILKINATYENYRGSNPNLYAEASAALANLSVSAYFKQPNFQDFRSLSFEQGAVQGGSIGYKINSFTTIIAHYKKAYDPTLGKVIESQYYEGVMGLSF